MTTGVARVPNVLLWCAILQLLDVLSTILFLSHGVAEANPLVKWSIGVTHGNLPGLLAIKSFACLFAVVAVQSGRTRVVVRMNRFFTVLVGWNLFALAVS